MIRPIDNRILIKPHDKEDKFMGMYYVPDEYKIDPFSGDVISVGEGVTEINPGDKIIYDGKFFVEITDEGETYRVVEKSKVFAVK